ncbi:alpha/beta fold hydrolase [Pseudonocardia sp. CA-142604]|uniref:alpha/beta fold hydrolase n=1 Tax=Pseudonocardia sp. CA-142604 TaxID=3240024 RepID=UPI003D8F9DBF
MTTSRTVDGPAGPRNVTIYGIPVLDGTVVLVHPINSAAAVWEHASAVSRRPTVVLDLRGHGGSATQGPFTVQGGYVDDVVAVLDALGRLGRLHLAGGSLGGSISLAVAALHSERVLGVVTFGCTGVPTEAIDTVVAGLEEMGTAGYFAEPMPDVVGTAYRAGQRVLDGTRSAAGDRPESVVAAIRYGALGADIRHLVGKVAVPVFAATGTEDPTCPPAMTEEIAAATGASPLLLDGVGQVDVSVRVGAGAGR